VVAVAQTMTVENSIHRPQFPTSSSRAVRQQELIFALADDDSDDYDDDVDSNDDGAVVRCTPTDRNV